MFLLHLSINYLSRDECFFSEKKKFILSFDKYSNTAVTVREQQTLLYLIWMTFNENGRKVKFVQRR